MTEGYQNKINDATKRPAFHMLWINDFGLEKIVPRDQKQADALEAFCEKIWKAGFERGFIQGKAW